MDEGCGYDDAGTKVLCNEESPIRNSQTLVAARKHGKYGTERGPDEYHEYRRYSKAHSSIVFVICAAVARCRFFFDSFFRLSRNKAHEVRRKRHDCGYSYLLIELVGEM